MAYIVVLVVKGISSNWIQNTKHFLYINILLYVKYSTSNKLIQISQVDTTVTTSIREDQKSSII